MTRIDQCVAVVMAAGESKRFGERKLYLDLAGKPVIYHVLDALKQLDLMDVFVVVQPGDELETAYPVLENPDYQTGQSSSIRVAMQVERDWQGVFFCPADQPFLDPTVMEGMTQWLEEGRIVVPRVQGRNGSPVLFSKTFQKELTQLRGEEGGRPIIRRHPEAVVYYELDDDQMFLDIDTAEDYQSARLRVREQSPKSCR